MLPPMMHVACSHNIAVAIFTQLTVVLPPTRPVLSLHAVVWLISCLLAAFGCDCRASANGIPVAKIKDIESKTDAIAIKVIKFEWLMTMVFISMI